MTRSGLTAPMTWLALVVRAVAVVGVFVCLMACRGQTRGGPTTTNCGQLDNPDPDGWQPIKKNAKWDCLDDIAGGQTLATSAEVTQALRTATNNCSTDVQQPNTTPITITPYTKTHALSYDRYTQKEGYVVALVENNSACDTNPPMVIKAGHKYYWVVESNGAKGRLSSKDDEVLLKSLKGCTPNGAGGEPGNDIAMFKVVGDKCNHIQTPSGKTPKPAIPPATNPSTQAIKLDTGAAAIDTGRKRPIDPPWVLWLGCAQDCCYADQ